MIPFDRRRIRRPGSRAGRTRRRLYVETLESRQLLAAQPIISEFVASNRTSLVDEDNQPSDWIELFNAGDEAIDLAGWHLTDNPGNLDKWTFPSTLLGSGEYRVVFASGKNRADSGAELHTNFGLDAAGEYLALVAPDGVTIVSQFGTVTSSFGEQLKDISYGIRDSGSAPLVLVGPTQTTSYHVPTDGSLGTSWTLPGFDDQSWNSAPGPLGYEGGSEPGPTNPPLTGYTWSVLADNPRFYWNFDEADGPAKELVRGQANDQLAPSANATRVAHSAIGSGLSLGRAASFDGASSFAATALNDGQMPGAWAIEFWIQAAGGNVTPNGSSGFRNDYVLNIAGTGSAGGDNPAVMFDQSAAGADNKIELFRSARTAGNGPTLADTNWHHVVLAFYGNGTTIGVANRTDVAIDGVVTTNIGDNNFSSVMLLSQALVVGAQFVSGTAGFEGNIDELAFYDLSGMTLAEAAAKVATVAAHHGLASTSAAESPLQCVSPVSYAYNVAPGGSAAYADAPLTKLNDNIIGSTINANYGTGEYAGWNTNDPVITFDLGETFDLSRVTIDYSVSHAAGVHAPDSVNVSFSSDGVSFGSAVASTAFNDFIGPGSLGWARRASVDISGRSARYARLTFANSDEWTFLGEVRFSGSQAGESGRGCGTATAGGATPELVGYWDFNDRTTDLSGGGNAATLEGATYSSDVPAALGGGKSLAFDPLDGEYAEVSDAAALRLSNAFTISGWVKSANLNQSQVYLISRNTAYANPYGSPSKQYAVIYEYVNNQVEFFGPSRLSGADPRPNSTLNVADTNWHHIAYTYDGATWAGYVDGSQAFSVQRQFVLDDTFASSWFFGTANPDVGFFSGWLDDIAMWNGALSSEEVASLSAGASPLALFGYEPLIGGDVGGEMAGQNATIYARHEFSVADPDDIVSLTLRMQYDDGFVAYLNGVKVAEANAPASLAWNSTATAARADAEAVTFTSFDVSSFRSALAPGQNVLAIAGLNVAADDDDFLLAAELLATTRLGLLGHESFFTTPTPGGPNGAGQGEPGPRIVSVTEPTGAIPDASDLTVVARVETLLAPTQSVSLVYRTNFNAEVTIAMRDDGTGGDAVAGDGFFTAVIPAAAAAPGQMIRYKVRAFDQNGRESHFPRFLDPKNSPEYLGAVVADPSVTSELPVFEYFLAPGTESAADTRGGTRGAVFYLGRLYDNVFVRLRGRSINSSGKLAYKFDFNQHRHFVYDPAEPPVEELDLGSTGLDKSYVRPILGFELFRDAGAEYSTTFPMRVQRNGQFFSVAWFIEHPDEDYLAHNGLDPEGAFYKANLNGFTTAAQGGYRTVFEGWDKVTRTWEGNSDIVAFTAGVELTGDALVNFLFDNVDIAAQINYMAAEALVQDADRLVNNFFVYRDSDGTGLWHMIVWDLDLALGQFQVASDTIHADDDYPAGVSHPFHGIQSKPDFRNPALWNNLLTKIIEVPELREMYLRRLRTLMDEFLKPPGTPVEELYFEARIDELFAKMQADVELDKARWGNRYGAAETFVQSLNRLKNEYLAVRRTHLFQTHTAASNPMPITTVLASGAPAKAFVPTSGNLGLAWTQRTGFDDSQWLAGTTGVGYDEDTTYASRLGIDLRSNAYPAEKRIDTNGDGTSENDSVYIRVPFHVDDPAALTQLRLRMQYDDGFIAYINGVKVAEINVPVDATWNSAAPAIHEDSQALVFADFDITAYGGPGGVLVAGENILAIHGLNDATNGPGSSSDMLFLPEIVNGFAVSGDSAGIPGAQVGNPTIEFGAIEFNPASGNQDEEYIALVNPNAMAVDISNWRLTGGVVHTFKSGTVIPGGGTLYVTPNFNAFRTRATGPAGGQGLFVQGNYDGHISSFGETIDLVASDGSLVSTVTTPSVPTDHQQFLRITEIMYHPADPSAEEFAAGFNDGDLFEFIELHNISSTTTLDLAGVHFTNGISFTFGNVLLPPGGFVVLVSHAGAFAARYGAIPIAGQYSGNLSNGGENLKLEGPDGGTIHEFAYDDTGEGWHPTTDGDGFSLLRIDPHGPLGDWGQGSAWRPSSAVGGTPGSAESALADFDANGRVDLVDLVYLQSRLGASGATAATGDLTGDGVVNRADIAVFAGNFGRIYAAPSPAVANSSHAPAALRREAMLDETHRRGLHSVSALSRRIRPAAVDQAIVGSGSDAFDGQRLRATAVRLQVRGAVTRAALSEE